MSLYLRQRRKPKNRKGVENMKNINRNIRVVAENIDCSPGFNIYLDFSGQREFLMFHRRNGLLYSLLRDGICVGDLARWAPGKDSNRYACITKSSRRHAKKLVGMVSHLLDVIEEYLKERTLVQEIVPKESYSVLWNETAA